MDLFGLTGENRIRSASATTTATSESERLLPWFSYSMYLHRYDSRTQIQKQYNALAKLLIKDRIEAKREFYCNGYGRLG
jgi:hypothetical protein